MFRRFQTEEESTIALDLVHEAVTSLYGPKLYEPEGLLLPRPKVILEQLREKVQAILNHHHDRGTYIANNIALEINTNSHIEAGSYLLMFPQGEVGILVRGWEVDPKWIPSEHSALTHDSSGAIVRR